MYKTAFRRALIADVQIPPSAWESTAAALLCYQNTEKHSAGKNFKTCDAFSLDHIVTQVISQYLFNVYIGTHVLVVTKGEVTTSTVFVT